MNEFDRNNFTDNGQGGNDNQQSGADNNTYYTPPQSEPPKQDYSYNQQNNGYSGGYNSNQDYSNQNYGYQPDSTQYTSSPSGNTPDKPPKKSKAGLVIAIILIACIVIAVAGIVATGNKLIGNTNSDNETTKSNHTEVITQDSPSVPTVDKEGNYTVAGVADKCMDSCVGISVYSQQMNAYSYFYGNQGQSDSSEPAKSGEGSGVLFSEENGKTYIITCAHVISGADSYKITLNNKKEYDAQLVAYDSKTDIGVLSINETGLAIAEFANSDGLTVGEQVVAIGCPGGLEFMNSITSGYISALDRPVSSSIGYDNKCIQTDAAINPGNSGGALFNMQGQVIGINSSKIASTEYEGMGFAVPTSTAVSTANSLIKSGYVEGRAKLGITYAPITSFNNANTIINELANKGFKDAQGTMVIREVGEDSDLINKDIKQYDMIVAVNGEVMTSTDIMTSALAESKPGDTLKLTIARIDNNEIKIKEIECKLIEDKG